MNDFLNNDDDDDMDLDAVNLDKYFINAKNGINICDILNSLKDELS